MNNSYSEIPEADAMFRAAWIAWRSDRNKAIALMRDVIERYPDLARGYSNLGFFLQGPHHISEAVSMYEHSLKLDPFNVDAIGHLARLYEYKLKAPDRAIALYRDAIEKHRDVVENDPELLRLHNGFGMALSHLGQTREAIEEFRHVLSIDPEDTFAEEWLAGELVEVGEFDEALAHYRVLLEDRPEHTSIRSNYAYALAEAGLPDQAIEELRLILRLLPSAPPEDEEWNRIEECQTKGFLGTLLAKRGEMEEGLRLLHDAITMEPQGQWHYELGNILDSLGQTEEALAQWKIAAAFENDYYADLAKTILQERQAT